MEGDVEAYEGFHEIKTFFCSRREEIVIVPNHPPAGLGMTRRYGLLDSGTDAFRIPRKKKNAQNNIKNTRLKYVPPSLRTWPKLAYVRISASRSLR